MPGAYMPAQALRENPLLYRSRLYRSRSTTFMVLAPCDYQNLLASGFDQRQIAFTRQRIHIELRDMSLTRVLHL